MLSVRRSSRQSMNIVDEEENRIVLAAMVAHKHS